MDMVRADLNCLKKVPTVAPMTTETAAVADATPQIRGNYPLAGDRIGPAWRRIWRELGDGQPRLAADFARDIAPVVGLAPNTVVNLLRQAAQEGLLIKSTVKSERGRSLARYRRHDVPLPTATAAVDGR